MYDSGQDSGLGLIAPVAGAIDAISSIFGGGTQDKNAGRIATNTDLYNRALAGDQAAYTQLKARSCDGCLPYDTWKDAAAKLAVIDRARAGVSMPSPIAPVTTAAASTGATGGINPIGVGALVPDPRQAIGMVSAGLPLIAAGLVIALALSSRRR